MNFLKIQKLRKNFFLLFLSAQNDPETVPSPEVTNITYLDGNTVSGRIVSTRAGVDPYGDFEVEHFPVLAVNASNEFRDPLYSGIVGLAASSLPQYLEDEWFDEEQVEVYDTSEDILFMNYLKKQGVITQRWLGVYFTNYYEHNHLYFGGYDHTIVKGTPTWIDLIEYPTYGGAHWDVEGGPVYYGDSKYPAGPELTYVTLDTGTTQTYLDDDTYFELIYLMNENEQVCRTRRDGTLRCRFNTSKSNGLGCYYDYSVGSTVCPGCTS